MAEELTPTNYKNSLTKHTKKNVELKIVDPAGSGAMKTLEFDDSTAAHKNKKFMAGFTMMMLAGSGIAEFSNNNEVALLKEAFRRHEVKPSEAVDAFWKAYGDPYVKAGEIKFRHLWKYIEQERKGRDGQLYSYREMVNIADKEKISTDHFERNDELAQKLREEYPERDVADLKVWRRL